MGAILGVHHAQITVPPGAEDEARAFYCGVLGLVEVAKPGALAGRGGFWVRAGETEVHVGTEPGMDRAATRAHLAYLVDDLAAWRERLGRAGVRAMEAVPIPGYVRFEFRDPFGNRVELIQAL